MTIASAGVLSTPGVQFAGSAAFPRASGAELCAFTAGANDAVMTSVARTSVLFMEQAPNIFCDCFERGWNIEAGQANRWRLMRMENRTHKKSQNFPSLALRNCGGNVGNAKWGNGLNH